MDIKIQAIHFEATEKLQDFIQKKVGKLARFDSEIGKVEVSLKVVKPESALNKEVDIRVYVNVITVLGKDKVGIMAKVCTYLADNGINILDISQTIVSGFFNMMMIADMGEKQDAFEQVRTELDELGQSIGVQVRIQREDIFDMMHRL